MTDLLFYLPGPSESSPAQVAFKVWQHLYKLKYKLDADLLLLSDDPQVAETSNDLLVHSKEVVNHVKDGLFYFPVSPVLGLGPSTHRLLRLMRWGARLVCDCHGDLREDLRNHIKNRELRLCLYSLPSALLASVVLNWHEWIVLHSSYLEGILRGRYDLKARTAIIPNAIEGELLEGGREGMDLEGRFNVCFHGRHAYEKGLDLLIEAFRTLPDPVRRQVHIYLSGTGPLTPRLMRMATSAGDGHHVHFIGHRPIEEVYSMISSADAMLYPSRFDNFPVAVLEAFALAGGPVFFSDRMGIGEFTGPALGAQAIPPSVEAVRDAIVSVVEGCVDVGAVVKEQRTCAHRYTWDRVIRKYVRFFNDVCQGPAPGPGGT